MRTSEGDTILESEGFQKCPLEIRTNVFWEGQVSCYAADKRIKCVPYRIREDIPQLYGADSVACSEA
jgi:hypothetical protein